jgi:hypothetical protein
MPQMIATNSLEKTFDDANLSYWSRELFDFIKDKNKSITKLDKCVKTKRDSLKTLIKSQLELSNLGIEEIRLLTSVLSHDKTVLVWTKESLDDLEQSDNETIKNASTQLKEAQQAVDNAWATLANEFLSTIFKPQVTQFKYPLTNSELAIMFLSDQQNTSKQTRKS